MLKKALIALAVIVAILLVVIAMQPAEYRVRRSINIAAPAADVFPMIDDFHRWDAWSPWAKLDPAMKKSIEGPASGAGSIYKWSGNSDVGAGQMTILESNPNERILIKLDFLEPFASTSTTEFSLRPDGGGTEVNWDMKGSNNFLGKAFSLFMNMDKMIGADFEKGLAQMKSQAEQRPGA